jgi:hypothetical protein
VTRWLVVACSDCGREIRMRDLGLARLIAKVWSELHELLHRKESK